MYGSALRSCAEVFCEQPLYLAISRLTALIAPRLSSTEVRAENAITVKHTPARERPAESTASVTAFPLRRNSGVLTGADAPLLRNGETAAASSRFAPKQDKNMTLPAVGEP